MDDGYAKQKFYEAVLALVGTASLQQRLRYAVFPLLVLRSSGGTVQHMPPHLELRFQRLMEKLTAKPPTGDKEYAPIDATDEEAKELAEEIFSIFVNVMGGL